MLSPQFLPLMFQVFWKVKDYDELSYHALTCLVQLASLNGSIMTSDEVKLQYLKSYMENFTKLVSRYELLSLILRGLLIFFCCAQLL